MFGVRLGSFARLMRSLTPIGLPNSLLCSRGNVLSTISLERFSASNARNCTFNKSEQKHGSSRYDRTNQNGTKGSEERGPVMNEDELKLLVELQQERETLIKNVRELEDRYKRALAETENVRSKMQRLIEETKLFAIQDFCKDLLEIADILELAKESVPPKTFEKSADENQKTDIGRLFKQFYDGVLMTQTNLHKIFNKNGLTQIYPLDEKFNPNVHEAVFEMVDETKVPGTVGVVVKPGYLLQQRPIRAAKVGIVKAKD